jgi:prepilin signal peptidase PulO-like enzyme (type II secretory pathway)
LSKVLTPIGMGFILCYAAVWCVLWAATPAYGLSLCLAAVLAIPCIWLSLTDLADFTIPDTASLIIAATGLAGQWIFHPADIGPIILVGTLITAVFWGAGALHYHMRGREGLGIGDAKLMGAGVLCVGPVAIWWVVLIAALGGIVAALIGRMRRPGPQTGIPFGPFLAYAIYIVFVFQTSGV